MDGEHWTPLADAVVRDFNPRLSALQLQSASFAAESAWDSPFQDEKIALPYQAPVFLDLPLRTGEPVRHVRLRVDLDLQPGNNLILLSLAELSVFP